jgi:hypothetical protein
METLKHPANRRGKASLLRGMQNAPLGRVFTGFVERVMGIEPTYEAWEAAVLPLNYTRSAADSTCSAGLPAPARRDQFAGRASWQVLATQVAVGGTVIESGQAACGDRLTACSARSRSFGAAALAASAVGETSEYAW